MTTPTLTIAEVMRDERERLTLPVPSQTVQELAHALAMVIRRKGETADTPPAIPNVTDCLTRKAS